MSPIPTPDTETPHPCSPRCPHKHQNWARSTKQHEGTACDARFISSLGYHGTTTAKLPRRLRYLDDRTYNLWLNKRLASKGNIVGWYLDLPAHEPYWAARKIRGPFGSLTECEKERLRAVQLAYLKIRQKRRASRGKSVLTTGELNTMRRVCAKEWSEEKRKPAVSKTELDSVLTTLAAHAAR